MITVDQVRATRWQTLRDVPFTRGGWGRLQESLDWPELQQKTWRPSRRESTRGALIVRGQDLGVHLLADGPVVFPDDVYARAAELLNTPAREAAA